MKEENKKNRDTSSSNFHFFEFFDFVTLQIRFKIYSEMNSAA